MPREPVYRHLKLIHPDEFNMGYYLPVADLTKGQVKDLIRMQVHHRECVAIWETP